MNVPAQFDQLAEFAVKDIETNMTVGLGTGKAASRAVRVLARRVKEESLNIRCVATSDATAELAQSLGLTVVELQDVDIIDMLFDGADEVDQNLVMLKGRGGAMTREKIVAHAADRRIYLVQKAKLVERIGQTGPLHIEVLSFAAEAVMNELGEYGLESGLLATENDKPIRTDNDGHVVLVRIPESLDGSVDSLHEFSLGIKHIPGVIEHGLFIDEADAVLVEDEEGDLELYLREDEGEDEAPAE